MNILLRIAFNGGRYHGFQIQSNAHSVCAELQGAMQKALGCRPDVKGCSRTDAGVHARDFCLSFCYNGSIPASKLALALNFHLPPDIRVLSAQPVAPDFHARYSAVGKQYEYVILNSAVDDPFRAGLYYRVAAPLDAKAMHQAGQALVGMHDFASFMAAGSSVTDTRRSISALGVHRTGDEVVMRVAADGYLYNMVRIMAGTLLELGRGRCAPEQITQILAAKNRAAAGPTLPARGLFLAKVYYPPQQLPLVL